MKKNLLLILLSVNLALTITSAKAQCIKEGSILIDGYYGFPNLYTAIFKSAYANAGSPGGVTIGGIGPLGLRGEYLLTDKLGLGVDIGFNNTKITQAYDDGSGNTYIETFSTQKLGVMASINYHFITKDKLDFYGVFGAGYGNRTFTFSSTEPGYTPPTYSSLIPIASKLGLGIRYFFTDNIGINLGLGIGQGGIINGGITFKI
jgi:outer membrane protein W